jgi:Mrp family chromosome partitioning ATPase
MTTPLAHPHWKNGADATVPERASTGIAGLDDILYGGLTPHRLYLVEGNPGAGKTTLALQHTNAAALRGDRAVIFAFDESTATLPGRATCFGLAILAGSVMKKRSGSRAASILELTPGPDGVSLSEPLTHLHGVLTSVPTDAASARIRNDALRR